MAVEPVHMRRGIAGLSMVVQHSLEYTPCAGSAFVFCNLSNNRIKVDEVEVFLKNQGKQRYLWRAIEQDGEVADVSLRAHRDGKTAKRFFKQFLKKCRNDPKKIVTDKLRNYGVAHRELVPDTIHDTSQYATIVPSFNTSQERGMRRFKSMVQAQRFLGIHAAVYNLFNLGRHLVSASHYLDLRQGVFASWKNVTLA